MKKSSDFIEKVKCLNYEYKRKPEEELKEFLVAENFRLLYVAITRAKQRLYISAPQMEKSFGKDVKTVPSIIFKDLLEKYVNC